LNVITFNALVLVRIVADYFLGFKISP